MLLTESFSHMAADSQSQPTRMYYNYDYIYLNDKQPNLFLFVL